MTLLVAVFLGLFCPPTQQQVRAFQATAPRILTEQTAAQHLIAAKAAGIVHNVRTELLLAIANHESRYIATTRTSEPGHRVSCGVMTPTPQRRCTQAELTLVGGYDSGAAHFKVWLDHYNGRETPALIAYVGGSGLVQVCARRGKWLTPRGSNACDVAYQFRRQARVIQQALSRRES